MRQRLRLAGVAAVALLAAGCFWSAPGAGPSRNAHNVFEDDITVETVGDLEELWSTSLGSPPIGSPIPVGSPVTSNQAVHVTAIGIFGAFAFGMDRSTGNLLWNASAPAEPAEGGWVSPLIFADDGLWFGFLDASDDPGGTELKGHTQHIDPDTGVVTEIQPGLPGLVNGVRGTRYLTSSLRYLSRFATEYHLIGVTELNDSNAGWMGAIDTRRPGGMVTDYSPLTLGNDYVFQAGPGTFWDGSPPRPPNLPRGNGIRGYSIEAPLECEQVILPERNVPFMCPTWATELDGTTATSPVLMRQDGSLADGIVYTGTDAGTMYAIDATNGDILWSTSVGSEVGAEPALADGFLYVPTTGSGLVVLDASTGDEVWTADLGSPVHTQPAVAGGVVFIGSWDGTFSGSDEGTLWAFDANGCGEMTCDPLWSDATGSPITGAPAVDRGRLYVGVLDGRLIAYALP